ncbi:type II secretion system protein GspD [Roseateles sp. SL47]|uniref:secretin N-terminal domain-containing protein n=1 Tax=Roseateles sp. SL47 TaxID=2995138 RepID=UPI00226DC5E5|nr:secretin N-terminal domain-containing protein [Roseateles sp. SL47]WAC71812.1 type II secretion system protein GspD [Roseateles sp. SL47]
MTPAPSAASATSKGKGKGKATANPAMSSASLAVVKFVDADVDAVARAVAAILGRPILVDPRVKGKMTLVSDEGLTRPQVYQYFAGTLRGLGYAVVENAGLLKIVPEGDAKVQSGTVMAGPDARTQDQIVTRIFQLQYENASNLVSVLRPLITANNTINVNPGNNSLVITDYADNQNRLAAIIAALDTPSATDVEVIPLKYVQAATVAQIVSKMVEGVQRAQNGTTGGTAGAQPAGTAAQSAAGSGPGAQVYADISSNALLVRAPNQARLQAIRALVSRLDKPGSNGIAGSTLHVIYLKHAEATRLASVLRAAFAAQDTNNGLSSSDGGSSGGGGGGKSGGSSTAFASMSGGSSSGSDSSASSSTSSKQSTAPVSAAAEPSTGGFIQADPATNALIITASEPRFRELSAVVDLLDSNRAQVYVESLIVEVDASKALDVGIQWKQIFNISSSTDLTLGTVVTALESMSGTNILSTANLVTLDNEEAKIVVGQNVPFVTGSYTTTSSSSSSPFQTIERKDVGITLRIRPQIGPNGSIRLTIYQESSSVSSTTTPGTTNAGPTTNKRSVESTVTVKDGKIIVLGGLIEDSDTADADHLYGLARIPLIGGLFSSRSHTRKKTNLLVFLRPVVMLDDDATERLTMDRYDMIRARQQALPENVRNILRDEPPPALVPAQEAAAKSQP